MNDASQTDAEAEADLRTPRAGRDAVIAGAVVLGVVLVGFVDLVTGVEVRLFPLYYFPLVLAAWRFGVGGGVVTSLLCTAAWTTAMYLGGREYAGLYVWAINAMTQMVAFLLVSVLIAMLHDGLRRERALGRIDQLTGIANRRSFYEQGGAVLRVCSRHGEPVALAFIDLDNFKNVNDTLGHDAGDALLRDVARAITTTLRASDLAARLGGDEFVILLPQTTGDDAAAVCESVRQRLARMPRLQACDVTASVGVVTTDRPSTDLEALVQAADHLMYDVKSDGKNHVLVRKIGGDNSGAARTG